MSEPETVEQVIADLRYKAQHAEYVTVREWWDIADHLEAALRREREEIIQTLEASLRLLRGDDA